jgi:HSP20 family protein
MMRRMMEDMDQIFGGQGQESRGGPQRFWAPAIEVSERQGNLVVCAELPGLTKDDVHLEATDDALIIEGERKQESKSEEGGVHRSERSYGHFYRAIPLPQGTNAEQAKANFNNGVLEVSIPLPQQKSNRRQIPVEAGTSGPHAGTGGQQSTTGGQPAGQGQNTQKT